MKKILYSLILFAAVFTSCGDNFDDPNLGNNNIYQGGGNIAVNITGVNNSLLENTSVVTTEYSSGKGTLVLNNIVYPKSSTSALKYEATFVKDTTFFTIDEGNKNYKATIEGIILDKKITLKGKIEYTLVGITRSYSGARLNLNGVVQTTDSITASLALAKDANGKEIENKIEITLSGYVKEGGKAVDVNIVADVTVDKNNVFTITNGTGSTDATNVALTGTYNNQILSINVATTAKP